VLYVVRVCGHTQEVMIHQHLRIITYTR
jgi:hypothetical protein